MITGKEPEPKFPPPWAMLVHGSGRPWLADCFSGMISWGYDDGDKYFISYLNTAIAMDSEKVTIRPDHETYVLPWNKVTIICQSVTKVENMHLVSVMAKTRRDTGSALQSVINMISASECGPALAFNHQNVSAPPGYQTNENEFWRSLQMGFEDELGAIMFAGLVAGLAEDGCFVTDAPAAASDAA